MGIPLSGITVRTHFQRKHNPNNPNSNVIHRYLRSAIVKYNITKINSPQMEVSFDSKINIGCHRQNYFSGS